MRRPPCCDKIGIKKGPWTPEEDIILVSYIQEHGPGNWRSVPTNTGLLRCSKSCRLRWTNYLRPGIKRGNFTAHEEGMIIHLQALLGNKWAAIASYLPQRTDNDIKNYWNTHLKKKLKKLQSDNNNDDNNKTHLGSDNNSSNNNATSYHNNNNNNHLISKNFISERSQVSHSSSSSSLYASSAENISRLLEGWMRSSSKGLTTTTITTHHEEEEEEEEEAEEEGQNRVNAILKDNDENNNENNNNSYNENGVIAKEEYLDYSILSFGNLMSNNGLMEHESGNYNSINNNSNNNPPPLSFLEKWLLDESGAHVEDEEDHHLPTIFS